jgi:hypothetical protein
MNRLESAPGSVDRIYWGQDLLGRRGGRPSRRIGVLLKARDTAVRHRDDVREGCVEGSSAVETVADVPAGDEHPPVNERQEAVGFGASREVSPDCSPAVAPHRVGASMVTSHPERQADREDAVKLRIQKLVKSFEIDGYQRVVEPADQFGVIVPVSQDFLTRQQNQCQSRAARPAPGPG